MNKKLLVISISIVTLTNIYLLAGASNTTHSYIELLLVPLLFSMALWFFLLRREVPIGFAPLKSRDIMLTLPIFLIMLATLIYVLLSGGSYKESMSSVLFSMFVSALIISVYEEIIFRAITLGSFLKAGVNLGLSVFLSALIFAFSHLNFIQPVGIETLFLILNSFMMGVFLGYIYFKTNNILLVITLHAFWDFTVFINQSLPIGKPSSVFALMLLLMTVLYFTYTIKKLRIKDKSDSN